MCFCQTLNIQRAYMIMAIPTIPNSEFTTFSTDWMQLRANLNAIFYFILPSLGIQFEVKLRGKTDPQPYPQSKSIKRVRVSSSSRRSSVCICVNLSGILFFSLTRSRLSR
nr:hypothetical protein Iba_chr09eCG3680 [Ipomoea batatas]